MTVSRLLHIPGIGVDRMGDAADAAGDPEMLRLENLDTDLRPPTVALAATRQAIDDDAANSYLPFQGHDALRAAAARHVERIAGVDYDWRTQCVSVAGGLNGILNTLLAILEPGDEVVLVDPIYAGLVNRIRLAGGVPVYVPLRVVDGAWTVDPDELAAAVGERTAAVLVMSPSMPTGSLLDHRHWETLAEVCERHDAWVVYNAAMERLRFDGSPVDHPASHPGLEHRTITIGSVSKELRMIGWRIGWVTGPAPIMADIGLVGLTNVVCQVGIAQQAAAAALDAEGADADVANATEEWKRRHDTVVARLQDYPVVRAHGGWSVLVDTRPLGLDPAGLSRRLFDKGRVAATPMNDWGPSGAHYVRLVFANEPPVRLATLRDRFNAALT